jgi:hypothetical protein
MAKRMTRRITKKMIKKEKKNIYAVIAAKPANGQNGGYKRRKSTRKRY